MKLTQQVVRETFDYNPETGGCVWLVDRYNSKKGDPIDERYRYKGNTVVSICGKAHALRRLIWLWMTGEMPTKPVIHDNADNSDFRWENLVLVQQGNTRAMVPVNRDSPIEPRLVNPRTVIPTQDDVWTLFDYDPKTGECKWKKHRLKASPGDPIDERYRYRSGYIVISLKDKSYTLERLVWLWMEGSFPDGDVIHLDGDRGNMRWDNLAVRDTRDGDSNTNIHRGVTHRGDKPVVNKVTHNPTPSDTMPGWRVTLMMDDSEEFIGTFPTKDRATDAARQAKLLFNVSSPAKIVRV